MLRTRPRPARPRGRRAALAALLLSAVAGCASGRAVSPAAAAAVAPAPPTPGALPGGAHAAAFTNPLLPAGADPWSVYRDGFYYYMHTTGRDLTIWKTRDLADLARAERRVVWTPPAGGPYSKNIWAPELHHLDGRWYLYFAADDGRNPAHRMWVLENPSPDPLAGAWTMKGKLSDPTDKWAIDGSVFEHRGRRYAVWSGWEGDVNGVQHLYIARLRNPWTVDGPRVRISTPEHHWEKVGDQDPARNAERMVHVDVNEGPQFLARGDKMFIVYSASGCWTEYYALGMLTARADADPMDPRSWQKSPRPVFQSSPAAGAYAVGHNSFFTSPDGRESFILYHANPGPGLGCGARRSPRAQRFTWRPDGTPDFGTPVPVGAPVARSSAGAGQ